MRLATIQSYNVVELPAGQTVWISTAMFYSIAIVLVIAAIAKLTLVLTDPFADLVAGWPLGVLWMALIVETSVIVVLFGRNSYSVKWSVSFALFAILLLISLARFLLGFESCGCFGSIVLPSYASALISVAILSLLIVSAIRMHQPILEILRRGTRAIQDELAPQARQWIGFMIVLSFFTILTFEPVKQRLQQMIFSEGVIAAPLMIDDLVVGQSHQGEITLHNNPCLMNANDDDCLRPGVPCLISGWYNYGRYTWSPCPNCGEMWCFCIK